jgi:hypothetical protein
MKFVKKSFVLFIAMLLLVSCSGVFVMIHTCIASNKTEVTFTDEHKCCSKNKKASNKASFEKKCCTVDYKYHKLSVVSVPVQEQTAVDYFVCDYPVFEFKITAIEKQEFRLVHSPPIIFQDFSIEFRQLLI